MPSSNFFCNFFVFTADLRTWAAARQICIDLGGRLMEVRTQEDYDRALQLSLQIGRFWLGGSDIQEEGVWVWNSNGERFYRNSFWFPYSTDPIYVSTEFNCLAFLRLTDNHVGMNPDRCYSARNYTCEFN